MGLLTKISAYDSFALRYKVPTAKMERELKIGDVLECYHSTTDSIVLEVVVQSSYRRDGYYTNVETARVEDWGTKRPTEMLSTSHWLKVGSIKLQVVEKRNRPQVEAVVVQEFI